MGSSSVGQRGRTDFATIGVGQPVTVTQVILFLLFKTYMFANPLHCRRYNGVFYMHCINTLTTCKIVPSRRHMAFILVRWTLLVLLYVSYMPMRIVVRSSPSNRVLLDSKSISVPSHLAGSVELTPDRSRRGTQSWRCGWDRMLRERRRCLHRRPSCWMQKSSAPLGPRHMKVATT